MRWKLATLCLIGLLAMGAATTFKRGPTTQQDAIDELEAEKIGDSTLAVDMIRTVDRVGNWLIDFTSGLVGGPLELCSYQIVKGGGYESATGKYAWTCASYNWSAELGGIDGSGFADFTQPTCSGGCSEMITCTGDGIGDSDRHGSDMQVSTCVDAGDRVKLNSLQDANIATAMTRPGGSVYFSHFAGYANGLYHMGGCGIQTDGTLNQCAVWPSPYNTIEGHDAQINNGIRWVGEGKDPDGPLDLVRNEPVPHRTGAWIIKDDGNDNCTTSVDATTAVDDSAETLTLGASITMSSGAVQGIYRVSSTPGGTGLATNTKYWLAAVSDQVVSFYDTRAHALAGGATGRVDLMDQTGTITVACSGWEKGLPSATNVAQQHRFIIDGGGTSFNWCQNPDVTGPGGDAAGPAACKPQSGPGVDMWASPWGRTTQALGVPTSGGGNGNLCVNSPDCTTTAASCTDTGMCRADPRVRCEDNAVGGNECSDAGLTDTTCVSFVQLLDYEANTLGYDLVPLAFLSAGVDWTEDWSGGGQIGGRFSIAGPIASQVAADAAQTCLTSFNTDTCVGASNPVSCCTGSAAGRCGGRRLRVGPITLGSSAASTFPYDFTAWPADMQIGFNTIARVSERQLNQSGGGVFDLNFMSAVWWGRDSSNNSFDCPASVTSSNAACSTDGQLISSVGGMGVRVSGNAFWLFDSIHLIEAGGDDFAFQFDHNLVSYAVAGSFTDSSRTWTHDNVFDHIQTSVSAWANLGFGGSSVFERNLYMDSTPAMVSTGGGIGHIVRDNLGINNTGPMVVLNNSSLMKIEGNIWKSQAATAGAIRIQPADDRQVKGITIRSNLFMSRFGDNVGGGFGKGLIVIGDGNQAADRGDIADILIEDNQAKIGTNNNPGEVCFVYADYEVEGDTSGALDAEYFASNGRYNQITLRNNSFEDFGTTPGEAARIFCVADAGTLGGSLLCRGGNDDLTGGSGGATCTGGGDCDSGVCDDNDASTPGLSQDRGWAFLPKPPILVGNRVNGEPVADQPWSWARIADYDTEDITCGDSPGGIAHQGKVVAVADAVAGCGATTGVLDSAGNDDTPEVCVCQATARSSGTNAWVPLF